MKLKRAAVLLFVVTLLLLVTAAAISRRNGVGIRLHDGKYLGYSAATEEWLFMGYPAVPVREDGPYVFTADTGSYAIVVRGDGSSPAQAQRQDVKRDVRVVVDGEEGTEFTVPLRSNHERSRLDFPGVERYLAISDLEGNFAALRRLLVGNQVMNASFEWTYGDGHLVLIGDMVDRGENVVPCLWLLYKLEAEAAAAGGAVHYVLGNHERYLLDGRVKSAARKYTGTFRATGLSQEELWSPESELGRWLRSKPVLVRVNRTLFVHGGVSPLALSMGPTLESTDEAAAAGLTLGNSVFRSVAGDLLHDPEGLLLYRGLAVRSPSGGSRAPKSHVAATLKHFDVDQLAIGHSLAERVAHDYGGMVQRIDTDHAGGVSEGLLFQDGQFWRVDSSGRAWELKPL